MADSIKAQAAQVAGAPVAHDSAHKHVTGAAVYIDDSPAITGQLYACAGGSEIASGTVQAIDLSRVNAAEGVVDVITAADVPGDIDIGPVFPGDPLFASERVEYVGQPLFAVLATSHDLARKAVRLATVNYNEASPVLDIRRAIDNEFYVRPPHRMQRGDTRKGFDRAATVIEGEMSVGGQDHFYLEGQVSIATPQEDGGMVVDSSTQNPTEAQILVARVLALPMNKVTVITRRMGGGFGGKETQSTAWSCIAALFARRSGRTVSCRLSRRDDMVMTGKRHNFLNRYRVGFSGNGDIEAIEYVLAGQCGNSPDLSDAIVDRAMFHCDNAYYLPDVCIDGLRCKSHTVSNTAFRGFGGPQGMIAMEAVIDEIAIAVGKDPLDVRKQNLYNTTDRSLTPYHQKIENNTVPAVIEQLEQESGYRARREEICDFNATSRVLKKGLALTPVKFGISFTVSHLNQAGALVHVYTDGSIHLNHGGTEMGQGLMVKVAQIVASEFGVSIDRIGISATRTDKVPNTSPTAASSGTDINGMAALQAAQTIKQRLIEFLGDQHGVGCQQIHFAGNCVQVADHVFAFSEVAKAAWMARVSLSATGFYKTPKIFYDREQARGRPFLYFAAGAAVSEVVIDTLTGESRLLRADIVHDVGNSVNPAIDIGQIEGGYIQGVGWLTSEELKWNDQGRLLTDGPATYKIPAIADAPPEFNVRLLEGTPNAEPTVFRSKAVGEPPLMLGISAWCAIRDAIASTGNHQICPELNAPATPEEILRSLTELNTRL